MGKPDQIWLFSNWCRAIRKSDCYHKEGHDAPCDYGYTLYMLLFGGVQIIVSQIPDFHNMAWLSVLSTVMSFSYSFIGLGLGIAKVIGTCNSVLAKVIRLYSLCAAMVLCYSLEDSGGNEIFWHFRPCLITVFRIRFTEKFGIWF